MIQEDAAEETQASGDKPQPWSVLLKLPQTWGRRLSPRLLTDPVWFFVATGFPIYWLRKAFRLERDSRRLGSVHRRRWETSLAALLPAFLVSGAGRWARRGKHRGFAELASCC